MRLTKAQTWALAKTPGRRHLVELIRAESHTCYLGRARRRSVGRRLRDLSGLRAARPRLERMDGGGAPGAARHDLLGQGDLPHPAGRGRPGGPSGGVLPLRRLQPLERPRGRTAPAPSAASATPISSGPTARAAASSPPPRPWPRPWRDAGRRRAEHRLVVCTGGEPLLQLDDALIEALHAAGFAIAVETNGTLPRRPGSTGSASAPRPTRRWPRPAARS